MNLPRALLGEHHPLPEEATPAFWGHPHEAVVSYGPQQWGGVVAEA
jgi:hypothetical protein